MRKMCDARDDDECQRLLVQARRPGTELQAGIDSEESDEEESDEEESDEEESVEGESDSEDGRLQYAGFTEILQLGVIHELLSCSDLARYWPISESVIREQLEVFDAIIEGYREDYNDLEELACFNAWVHRHGLFVSETLFCEMTRPHFNLCSVLCDEKHALTVWLREKRILSKIKLIFANRKKKEEEKEKKGKEKEEKEKKEKKEKEKKANEPEGARPILRNFREVLDGYRRRAQSYAYWYLTGHLRQDDSRPDSRREFEKALPGIYFIALLFQRKCGVYGDPYMPAGWMEEFRMYLKRNAPNRLAGWLLEAAFVFGKFSPAVWQVERTYYDYLRQCVNCLPGDSLYKLERKVRKGERRKEKVSSKRRKLVVVKDADLFKLIACACGKMRVALSAFRYVIVMGTTHAGKTSMVQELWRFQSLASYQNTRSPIMYFPSFLDDEGKVVRCERLRIIDWPSCEYLEGLSERIFRALVDNCSAMVVAIQYSRILDDTAQRFLKKVDILTRNLVWNSGAPGGAEEWSVPCVFVLTHADELMDKIEGRKPQMEQPRKTVHGYGSGISTPSRDKWEEIRTELSRIIGTVKCDAAPPPPIVPFPSASARADSDDGSASVAAVSDMQAGTVLAFVACTSQEVFESKFLHPWLDLVDTSAICDTSDTRQFTLPFGDFDCSSAFYSLFVALKRNPLTSQEVNRALSGSIKFAVKESSGIGVIGRRERYRRLGYFERVVWGPFGLRTVLEFALRPAFRDGRCDDGEKYLPDWVHFPKKGTVQDSGLSARLHQIHIVRFANQCDEILRCGLTKDLFSRKLSVRKRAKGEIAERNVLDICHVGLDEFLKDVEEALFENFCSILAKNHNLVIRMMSSRDWDMLYGNEAVTIRCGSCEICKSQVNVFGAGSGVSEAGAQELIIQMYGELQSLRGSGSADEAAIREIEERIRDVESKWTQGAERLHQCGHMFHRECIAKSLVRQFGRRAVCPVAGCRKRVEEEDLKKILERAFGICGICEEFLGRRFRRIACGHEFHSDCLAAWIGIIAACPVCAREVDSVPRKRILERWNMEHICPLCDACVPVQEAEDCPSSKEEEDPDSMPDAMVESDWPHCEAIDAGEEGPVANGQRLREEEESTAQVESASAQVAVQVPCAARFHLRCIAAQLWKQPHTQPCSFTCPECKRSVKEGVRDKLLNLCGLRGICGICRRDICEREKDFECLSCGHQFHVMCIAEVLLTKAERFECPVCARQVDEQSRASFSRRWAKIDMGICEKTGCRKSVKVEDAVFFPCDHLFHRECVMKHRAVMSDCPNCRSRSR